MMEREEDNNSSPRSEPSNDDTMMNNVMTGKQKKLKSFGICNL